MPQTDLADTSAQVRASSLGQAEDFACPHCEELGTSRSFKTKRGLGQHVNLAHKEIAHKATIADLNSRTNKRTTNHDLLLLAEVEAAVEGEAVSGVKGRGVNQLIVNEWQRRYPDSDLTLERVRNMRKKSKNYESLVTEARAKRDSMANNPDPNGPGDSSSSSSDSGSESSDEDGVFEDAVGDTLFLEAFGEMELEWTGLSAEELCNLDPARIDSLVNTALEVVDKRMVTPKGKARRPPRPPPTENRRQRRRRLFRYTQDHFSKDPSACIKAVVAGNVGPGENQVPPQQLADFWEQQFSAQADFIPFNTSTREEVEGLDNPITSSEVKAALKKLKRKATGQDKVSKADLTRIGFQKLALLYNTFLVNGYAPSELKDSKVTLIPKKNQPRLPSEFRPISVFSVLLRLFHAILEKRLSSVPLKSTQKGFIRRDGIAENSFILKSLLKYAKRQKHDCYLAFIDLSKAFDSVSHPAIVAALKRLGIPPRLISYIEALYQDSYTDINGRRVKLGRGIRQGDALSTFLFNAVVDMCMDGIEDEFGYPLGEGLRISELFFADDCVLASESKAGLLRLLNFVTDRFRMVGLSVNVAKSSTLAFRWNGTQKKHAVDETPFARLGDNFIPPAGPHTTLKYLGLNFTAYTFKTDEVVEDLKKTLGNVSKAPLTVPQKLLALRQNVIPGLFHKLILGDTTKSTLLAIDRNVRKFVREVTHLPMDTPTAFFHAKIKDGGLGISSLTTDVAYMRTRRFQKLLESDCVYTQSLLRSVGQSPRPIQLNGTLCCVKADAQRGWKQELQRSVDCGQLVNNEFDETIRKWMIDVSLRQGDFVKALHVRAKALKTPSRQARRDGSSKLCRVDRAVASLTHISQECDLSHGRRISRHDKVVRKLGKVLSRSWKTETEPHIPVERSFLKPDLVIHNDRESVVVDPIIVGDNVCLRERAAQKVQRYSREAVMEYVQEKRGLLGLPQSDAFSVIGVPITYRGEILASTRLQLKRIGVPATYLSKVVFGALVDSWFLWRAWAQNTRS